MGTLAQGAITGENGVKSLFCAGIELTVQVDHVLCDGIIIVTGLRGEPARDPRDLDGDLDGFRWLVISTELCV